MYFVFICYYKMSKNNVFQEVVGVNNLIDRFLSKNAFFASTKSKLTDKTCKEIVDIVNTCFSIEPQIDKSYVANRIDKIKQYRKILNTLIDKPIVKQRSTEWYNMRQTLITASDFAQALGDGKFGTQKQLFIKKCGYEEDKFNNNLPALKWGVMFEQMACEIYARRNFTKVHDFGLLRHPNVDFFGASPDGITDNGILLEIKCPYIRKRTGEIPLQYFYQIQGQLDVCQLDECDYLECGFEMYSNEKDFWSDNSLCEKGVIFQFKMCATDSDLQYKYSKITVNVPDDDVELKAWVENACIDTPNIDSICFWKINTFSCIRIYKDDVFLKEKLEQIKDVWDKITLYKTDFELYKADFQVKTPRATTKKIKPDIESKDSIAGYAFCD